MTTGQRRDGASFSSMVAWASAQLRQFVGLVAQMLLVGAVRALLRRELSAASFLVALLSMLAGVGVVAQLSFAGAPMLSPERELQFWSGIHAVMLLAGFLAGRVGRRVAFWEIYLATVIAAGLCAVELWHGWSALLTSAPGDEAVFLRTFLNRVPGEDYFGPMWDRLFMLSTVSGFLLAVFGGSIAFLLFADLGRLDRSLRLEWSIGARHLSGRRGMVSATAVVAVLGIALGVAALIAVTAVMSGYERDIQERILSTNPHFVIQKYGIDFSEHAAIAEQVLDVDGVVAATPFVFNEALLSVDDMAMGILLKGVDPANAGDVTQIEANLCRAVTGPSRCEPYDDGRRHLAEHLDASLTVPSLLVGVDLFQRLGKPLGAIVTMTTPVGIAGARGNAPRRMQFRLAGVFRSGMHEFDARLTYMHLRAAQAFLGMDDTVSGVEFRVRDPERVELVAKQALLAVGKRPYHSMDWRELNSSIFLALKLQKIVMFLVLAFIVVVAAFNIASTLFMTVAEKAPDIGVLKSMGARDGSIMKIFVLEGWLVGGAGTLSGVALGLALCALLSKLSIEIAADVYMVGALSVLVRPTEILLTVIASLVISHLATLYPALQAARQHPVDALRWE